MHRREHLKGLLGLAASGLSIGPTPAADPVVPPNGIGRRIRHVSYTDQGGRPDGVQIMVNRRHVYVGHMFSDGVTILDAADPRQLKPVGHSTERLSLSADGQTVFALCDNREIHSSRPGWPAKPKSKTQEPMVNASATIAAVAALSEIAAANSAMAPTNRPYNR